MFPIIALITCNYLTISASNMAIEQLFSFSQHLCTDIYTSMKAKAITDAICSKQWIKEGLVDLTKAV